MCPFCVDTNGGFWRYNLVDFAFKVERNVGSDALIGKRTSTHTRYMGFYLSYATYSVNCFARPTHKHENLDRIKVRVLMSPFWPFIIARQSELVSFCQRAVWRPRCGVDMYRSI
jgi:hypothetical protein